MKAMILEARLVRAAMQCQATGDVRGYLNGIFIGKDGTIAGTNGHILFVTKGEHERPEEDIIIRIHGKIPVAATDIDLTPANDSVGVIRTYCSFDPLDSANKLFAYEQLEGKYPDTTLAIPKDNLAAVEAIGLNPSYVNLATNIFGKDSVCRFEFRGENSPVVVTHPGDWPEETLFLIMTGRL